MPLSNIFTKSLVRANLPRLPSDSQFCLYIDSTGSTAVLNDDGTLPMIFKRDRIGDLVLIEALDVSAETFSATIISDTKPDLNKQWWFSDDAGLTKNRIRILTRPTGSFGYYYSVTFQVIA